MSNIKIALDAGHGGSDPGAVYDNRLEKEDNLKLTKAVGKLLEDKGVDVFYVRDDDIYETPFKKATDANSADADLFVSIHRNSSDYPDTYNGVESLVYNDTGIRHTLATNINKKLEDVGFKNLGITPRPNLVVLKRTRMPAIMLEVGFINSKADNELFDDSFNDIAAAIADGILESIDTPAYAAQPEASPVSAKPEELNSEYIEDPLPASDCNCQTPEKLYRVQVGAFSNRDNAQRMLDSLLIEGFPAFMIYEDDLYKVQVGAFTYLTNAIKMEQRLRRFRYNTYIVYK